MVAPGNEPALDSHQARAAHVSSVLPLVLGYLHLSDGLAVRHSCCATRDAYDQTSQEEDEARVLAVLEAFAASNSVSSVSFYLDTPLTPAIATALAGFGPKLTTLSLTHGVEHFLLDKPAPPELTPPPPQPAEAERAAASVEQLLRSLGQQLEWLVLCHDAAGRYVPAKALRCITLCTALQSLSLQLPAVPADTPVADGVAAELSALQAVASLSTLRRLELWGGGPWKPPVDELQTMASNLYANLSRLTGLTSLRLRLRRLRHFGSDVLYDPSDDPSESAADLSDELANLEGEGRFVEAIQLRHAATLDWKAGAGAALYMPGLVELRTTMQASLGDLAALTSLTCLRVGALIPPLPPPAAAAAGVANNGPAADSAGPQPDFALPPALRRLETHAPMEVQHVALLRPSPPPPGEAPCALLASGRLWGWYDTPWVLSFGVDDADELGAMRETAAAAFKRAVGVLSQLGFPGPQGSCPRGLRIRSLGRYGLRAPEPPDTPFGTRSGSHVDSWLGEVAVLRLEWLELACLEMPARDMLALARCSPELRGLDLRGSSYSASSLVHLTGLRHLHTLKVSTRGWSEFMEEQVICAHDVVESSLLALTATPEAAQLPAGAGEAAAGQPGPCCPAGMALPRLQLLSVRCPESRMPLMEELVGPARRELARRGTGADLVLEPFG